MYILDGKTPVPTDDIRAFSRMFEDAGSRRVARDQVGALDVSTVFLGTDHAFGCGPPLLFETMVFGVPDDEPCERYSTWDEAVAGHAAMVAWAKENQP